MILVLATRYRKCVAFLLFFVAGLSYDLMAMANEAGVRGTFVCDPPSRYFPLSPSVGPRPSSPAENMADEARPKTVHSATRAAGRKPAIGGPNQPEMTSFKSVNN